MAKVTYNGNLAGIRIGPIVFPKGETVEVTDSLAKGLLDRADFDAPPKAPAKGKTNTGEKAE